ncbi:hypothetical protein KVT40_007623 [Elsinoe batatas]|uniref:RING-type domain-containing protein n=1 Tax=Elsinoe batatas TaxID=2601811 RepID=A0A8K0PCG8_9PEZI|nr:hypothetical protein KVT40_007623 [Elsinoe batatas]
MGTLSGQDVRLPDHCEHKLPTSCRLTSLRNCCACADERAHSPTYTTYIDGVGLVPRGRRWDRYCWFCKEFWSHRVAATNLLPSQTRIPEVPDQTAFLERWYDFHRGYRIVTTSDGREERIAVLGEPWGDVSPGHLPRTLDELRAGTVRSAADPVQHITVEWSTAEDGPSLEETFDRLLEQVDEEDQTRTNQTSTQVAHDLATTQPSTPSMSPSENYQTQSQLVVTRRIAGNVMQPTGSRQAQQRRLAALGRELGRMSTGVQRVSIALRDLGELPEASGAIEELAQLERSLGSIVSRNGLAANRTFEDATANAAPDQRVHSGTTWVQHQRNERQRIDRDISALDALLLRVQEQKSALETRAEDLRIDILQGQVQIDRWRQEGRGAENARRVFGTREDMDREDWVSPINQMFTRAYDRFRDAEQARRENRTPPVWGLPPPAPGRGGIPATLDNNRQNTPDQPAPHSLHDRRYISSQQDILAENELAIQQSLAQYYSDLASPPRSTSSTTFGNPYITIDNESRHPTDHAFLRENPTTFPHTYAHPSPHPSARDTSPGPPPQPLGLDVDPDRPEPRTDEDLTVKLDCRICYTQPAEIACLPCGHLVMCRWCSEQHCPGLRSDRTVPERKGTQCPACRKVVKKKVRVRYG